MDTARAGIAQEDNLTPVAIGVPTAVTAAAHSPAPFDPKLTARGSGYRTTDRSSP